MADNTHSNTGTFSSSSSSETWNQINSAKHVKRKKAQRACGHCQKAHLTCDDNRPCNRCIKRGLSATCFDGHKKRAKYLQDIQDDTLLDPSSDIYIQHNNPNSRVNNSNNKKNIEPKRQAVPFYSQNKEEIESMSSPVDANLTNFKLPRFPSTENPLSHNAGLGLDIGLINEQGSQLSSFSSKIDQQLRFNDPVQSGTGLFTTNDNLNINNQVFPCSSVDMNNPQTMENMTSYISSKVFDTNTNFSGGYPSRNHDNDFGSRAVNVEYTVLSNILNERKKDSGQINSPSLTPTISNNSAPSPGSTTPLSAGINDVTKLNSQYGLAELGLVNMPDQSNLPETSPMDTFQPIYENLNNIANMNTYQRLLEQNNRQGKVEDDLLKRNSNNQYPLHSYNTQLKPYDYRKSYHHLISHIRSRMTREDIMRICKALTHFRPSFMSQIMHLSEEDLIFMEMSFLRALTEFERLIGCSGTPTAVWRRTGEITLVGKEFSILTHWPKDKLTNPNKPTYIYELMDTKSAVDYWENYSLLAFDNSQQSMTTTCTLLGSDGTSVPCAFCFTIKRDIFDVPLAIVGNFLPIFQSK